MAIALLQLRCQFDQLLQKDKVAYNQLVVNLRRHIFNFVRAGDTNECRQNVNIVTKNATFVGKWTLFDFLGIHSERRGKPDSNAKNMIPGVV